MHELHTHRRHKESSFSRLKKWVVEHERRLSTILFVAGFIFDNLTLVRIDRLYDVITLASYIIIATIAIIILHFIERNPEKYDIHYGNHNRSITNDIKLEIKHNEGDTSEPPARKGFAAYYPAILHFVLQFAYGGLASSFMIFYSRSATFIGSWPFLIFLGVLFFGNEIFHKRYQSLTFRIGVFFTVLFSYCVLFVPVFIGTIGKWVFIGSGIISVILTVILLGILYKINREKVIDSFKTTLFFVILIYGFFNVAYFANLIPPVPLSLKEIGIYHNAARLKDGNYQLIGEPRSFFDQLFNSEEIFHRGVLLPDESLPKNRVYAFTAVFAPTVITTPISHVWSKYDSEKREWVETTKVNYSITGGRDAGYRAFSFIQDPVPGLWRVDVKTQDDLLIGRKVFRVSDESTNPDQVLEIKVQ